MNEIEPSILELMHCPVCKGDLHYTKESVFVCLKCFVCYPHENGVFRLNAAQARPLDKNGRILEKSSIALIRVSPPNDPPFQIRLTLNSCIALGRKLDDPLETLVFDAHFNMVLDDNTKKILSKYMAQKMKGAQKAETKTFEAPGKIGTYERLSDVVLTDPQVSRLHAMLFYDDKGVGILDLVSQNGTFINGQEVEMGYLQAGDELKLGKTTLTMAFAM